MLLDSDGCVFDTMTVKHRKCFIPLTVSFWGLGGICSAATETLEYVNLYSAFRGANRFRSLVKALRMIERRAEAVDAGISFPGLKELEKWLESEDKPSIPSLKRYIEHHPGEKTLVTALEWSEAVNKALSELSCEMPPFEGAARCIERVFEFADIAVVSTSPEKIVAGEWSDYGLIRFVGALKGQESGRKTDTVKQLIRGYDKERVLMLGDAFGDREAARHNGIHFFPIIPGQEKESWRRFMTEGIERFKECGFGEIYQSALDGLYDESMNLSPDWLNQ